MDSRASLVVLLLLEGVNGYCDRRGINDDDDDCYDETDWWAWWWIWFLIIFCCLAAGGGYRRRYYGRTGYYADGYSTNTYVVQQPGYVSVDAYGRPMAGVAYAPNPTAYAQQPVQASVVVAGTQQPVQATYVNRN